MGLVRCLVGREACVAVDAVDAVLGREADEGVVVLRHLVDEALGEVVEGGLDFQPVGFMGVEPVAVVVHHQFPQERERVGVQCWYHLFTYFN